MSGSALRAAVCTGDEKAFLVRGPRAGVARKGMLGFLSARMEVLRGALVLLVSLDWVEGSWDAGVFLMGDLKGDLKGERNGFASVWEAASMRRRLAA